MVQKIRNQDQVVSPSNVHVENASGKSLVAVCDSGRLLSMEIVEVNPVLDDANRTALLGVELVMSAMGKKIL